MNFGNCFKGKKILITGHTGFKGSWLSIWLKQLEAEVYGYALPPCSELDNFTTCKLQNKIHHYVGDIRDANKLQQYFKQVQPDIAFHLAAQPLVLLSYQDPVGTFETNLMGTVNFFEAVRQTLSVKVAINVTSDKCYDNREWVWGYREIDPIGGKDPYSASKGCSELITSSYLNSFFKEEGTCLIASARAGNVIGGGDWALDRIVPDYFRAVKANRKLLVRNSHATRPWQHVLEPLSGYLNLAAALWTKGRNFTGSWNFGPEDTSNYTVKDLLENILLMNDAQGGYSVLDANQKQHEAVLLKLDISKAVNQLKWNPVLNFDETVAFTVSGYNDDLSGVDLFEKRKQQIYDYTLKAANKNILWAR
jgi:CDP-glucose 4,6-dehydratase